MTLVEAINTGKPFRLIGGNIKSWICYVDDPYPWLIYDECSTYLKQFRIKNLIEEGGLTSVEWEVKG